MNWKKHGLIFQPSGNFSWMQKYAILPTPEFLPERNCIRVYFASTDENNNGTITYLECDAKNPSRILKYPDKVLLSPGPAGCFDDCGVNPSSIFNYQNKKYLTYIGYQRTEKIPYLMLSGCVELNGDDVVGRKLVPMLERTNQEPSIRSAPFVLPNGDHWLIYYVSAHEWKTMKDGFYKGKHLPVYEIKILQTKDFIHFAEASAPAIKAANENEFGFGRPWVIKDSKLYRMWYSVRTASTGYRIGYAESFDGFAWTRKDQESGIDISVSGWDSEMICYAAVIKAENKTWMFYNGNGHGLSGMGLAELVE